MEQYLIVMNSGMSSAHSYNKENLILGLSPLKEEQIAFYSEFREFLYRIIKAPFKPEFCSRPIEGY